MLVFKFGGASVKNAGAVRNLANILQRYPEQLVVVISAMGKTTNALEKLAENYFKSNSDMLEALQEVKTYHYQIIDELFSDKKSKIFFEVNRLFDDLDRLLHRQPSMNYDYEYDQIVSFGEILATIIVSSFLNENGIPNKWVDARNIIKTDSNFRDAKVDYSISEKLIAETFAFSNTKIYVTQGFIGSDINNLPTTLGREGSDYSAALIAYCLNAKEVTIWKDVPGVLNADPKYFDDTIKLEKLSYLDAIELTYYGASVIHPKTIKPLQNKKIKLYVKSFLEPDKDGTVIGDENYENLLPSFIFKREQTLLKISPIDFSFMDEENLQHIFGMLSKHKVKINLMQNSAISFKICVNNDKIRIPKLIEDLQSEFYIKVDRDLELITIRYYDEDTINRVMEGKKLILKQQDSKTIQMIVK